MTRAVLEEAGKLGAHVGVVDPTRESRSMYERLGFVLHRQGLANIPSADVVVSGYACGSDGGLACG